MEEQKKLDICNSGIWAARKDELIRFEEGLKIGYSLSEEENESMGVDDLESLTRAQERFVQILIVKTG